MNICQAGNSNHMHAYTSMHTLGASKTSCTGEAIATRSHRRRNKVALRRMRDIARAGHVFYDSEKIRSQSTKSSAS